MVPLQQNPISLIHLFQTQAEMIQISTMFSSVPVDIIVQCKILLSKLRTHALLDHFALQDLGSLLCARLDIFVPWP